MLKPVVVLVALGLGLAAGAYLLSGQDLGIAPDRAATLTIAVAPPPAPPAIAPPDTEITGALPAPQAVQPAPSLLPEDPNRILVTKRPIEVLAGPSAKAAFLYGFPAGRPFRVISREAGYAQIRDLKSGASGWIEEAALVPAPIVSRAAAEPAKATPQAKTTATSTPPKAKPAAQQPKPAAAETATAEAEPVQRRRRGLLGGLFRNSDDRRPNSGFGFGAR